MKNKRKVFKHWNLGFEPETETFSRHETDDAAGPNFFHFRFCVQQKLAQEVVQGLIPDLNLKMFNFVFSPSEPNL